MIQERLLQTMIGKFGLGNQQHSAGRHVQPVNDERTGSFGIFPSHQRIDRRLGFIFPRHRQQTFGLMDDRNFSILIKCFHLIIY